MGRELTNISFEEWITYVFDHPTPNPDTPTKGGKSEVGHSIPWYHELDCDWWDTSRQPDVTVAYLTRLFENAPYVLAPFSDARVNQGLWYLVDNSCSDHMFALLDTRVSWPERKRCLFAIFTLFERFFAPRCSPHLSHLDTLESDTGHVSPLNLICYMWWDILPVAGKPNDPTQQEIDKTCLDVMRRSLELASVACQESALHGLGHWHLEYPTEVEAIISQFLKHHSTLRPELKAYALDAKQGLVQ